MIRVLFFASLRERLECAETSVPAAGCSDLLGLREQLSTRGPQWRAALSDSSLQTAVNRAVTGPETALESGDEVAFFPPVTGG